MYGESNMGIYYIMCKIETQCKFAIWCRELKQVLCDNLEEWDGKGDGRDVQEGVAMGVPMADSCWCDIKPQNSVKQICLN